MLTGEKILTIKTPERLFSKNDIENQFRLFVKQWHPDVSKDPKANEIFIHINMLYEEGIKKISDGQWDSGELLLKSKDLKEYLIRYSIKRPFELGEMTIGETTVSYILEEKYKNLYTNCLHNIKEFKFSDDKMKKEVIRYLPKLLGSFKTIDNKYVIVLEKHENLISLRDLLEHLGGKIDPRHVAWIMSTLHNFTCYLNYLKLSHNNISLDTYFVSPETHYGALLGGWWYSIPFGQKLLALPKRSLEFMKKGDIYASNKIDLESIRDIGRELLGDRSGTRIKDTPKAMLNWLRLPSSGDPIKDYSTWNNKILKESFGERKFITLDVDTKTIYRRK